MEVITIDVTAIDPRGVPVRGLTADEFIVTVAGARRQVQAVDFLEFGGLAGTVGPTSASTRNDPAAPEAGNRGGRVIVLAVDDLSAKPGENAGLLAAAERIVGSLDSADLVGLTTTCGFGPHVSPTTDRAEVTAALRNKKLVGCNESYTGSFYISLKEAFEAETGGPRALQGAAERECGVPAPLDCSSEFRATARRLTVEVRNRREYQLRAYASLLEAMQTLPAPRVFVVLGRGLATDGRLHRNEIQRIGQLAAAADVRFYALTDSADGVDITDRRPGPCLPPTCVDHVRARSEESAFLSGGVQIVASAAGGEAFRVIGQADRFFERVLLETSAVYRLAVEVPEDLARNRDQPLRVRTTRSGVTVRARPYLTVPARDEAALPTDEALRQRIGQGGYAFGVPIALGTAVRGNPRLGRQEIGVSVRVPGDVAGPVSLAFAVLDSSGRVEMAGRRAIDGPADGDGYDASFLVPVRAGATYRLRLAAADAAGRIGSVERRILPTAAEPESIPTSDLWLEWSGEDGRRRFTVETVPASASALSCSIELYPTSPAAVPEGLRIRFSIARDEPGETVAFTQDVVPQAAGSGASRAEATVSLAGRPAGVYRLAATVLDGSQAVGEQSAIVFVRRRE